MKLQQGIFLHAARKLGIKANTKSYFQPELTCLPEIWEEGRQWVAGRGGRQAGTKQKKAITEKVTVLTLPTGKT